MRLVEDNSSKEMRVVKTTTLSHFWCAASYYSFNNTFVSAVFLIQAQLAIGHKSTHVHGPQTGMLLDLKSDTFMRQVISLDCSYCSLRVLTANQIIRLIVH